MPYCTKCGQSISDTNKFCTKCGHPLIKPVLQKPGSVLIVQKEEETGTQPEEIKEGEKVEEHKHEGETVNLEVRVTKNRISFLAGDTEIGYYSEGTWCFKGKVMLGDDDEEKMRQVHRKDDIDDAGNKAVKHAQKVWAL